MPTPAKGGALAGTLVLAGGERGERAGCYVWDEACVRLRACEQCAALSTHHVIVDDNRSSR